MIRFLIIALMVIQTVAAFAANPATLALRSGKVIPVIEIAEMPLHGSEESALVLRYQTNIDVKDIGKLWREVEEVWFVFQKIADKRGLKAAVVEAREKQPTIGISRSAGWSWKKGSDGTWHRPGTNDHSLVPKDKNSIKIGNIFGK